MTLRDFRAPPFERQNFGAPLD